MANKEILLVVDAFSHEKDIEKEIVFAAIEDALKVATVKRYENRLDARVSIDRKTGGYETFRRWQVLDLQDELDAEAFDPELHVSLDDARKRSPSISVGEYIEEPMDSVGFGRIEAQTAKQVIVQRVRDAERRKVVEAYRDRVGDLVTGIIKKVERGNVYLDLGGNVEAYVPGIDCVHRHG